MTPTAWSSLVVTASTQSVASMALLTLPAMAPAAATALGISPGLVGTYIAICYLAAMLTSLVSGALLQRLGAIRVTQYSLLSCALGLLLCTVPWLPAMVVGALFIGAGYGPMTPASSHLLARTIPPRRMSLVFSVKQTGVPAGGILAGALVPGMALAFGWQAALVVVAVACAACLPLTQPLRARLDSDRVHCGGPLSLAAIITPLRMVLRHRPLVVLALCSFMFSAIQVTVTAYMVTYLNQTLGLTLLAAGAALSVSQLAGAAGRVTWGAVADWGLGPRNTLMLLAVLMIVGSLLTASLQGHWSTALIWIVVALLGVSGIGWNGVYLAAVARQAPEGQAGMATGGTLLFTYMGVVFGAPLFGALASSDGGNYRWTFAALAVPATLALVLLIWRALTIRRDMAEKKPA